MNCIIGYVKVTIAQIAIERAGIMLVLLFFLFHQWKIEFKKNHSKKKKAATTRKEKLK